MNNKKFNNIDRMMVEIAKEIVSKSNRKANGYTFYCNLKKGVGLTSMWDMDIENVLKNIKYDQCLSLLSNVKTSVDHMGLPEGVLSWKTRGGYFFIRNVIFCGYFQVPNIILQSWVKAMAINIMTGGKISHVRVFVPNIKARAGEMETIVQHSKRTLRIPTPWLALREGAVVDGKDFVPADLDIFNYEPYK